MNQSNILASGRVFCDRKNKCLGLNWGVGYRGRDEGGESVEEKETGSNGHVHFREMLGDLSLCEWKECSLSDSMMQRIRVHKTNC